MYTIQVGGKVPDLLDAYASGNLNLVWDTMKQYVFGGNDKFYAGLTSRRVAEYLLFTAETPKEIEEAYRNTYESVNAKHRADFYTEEDLRNIRNKIVAGDSKGLCAIDDIIKDICGQERG